MAEGAPTNHRLLPWYIGIVLVFAAVIYVGYQMWAGATRWRASDIGAISEQLESQLILELMGDVSGCRVLDVGCGDGELALELTRRGAIVTGIDASVAMIQAAKRRAKQHNV